MNPMNDNHVGTTSPKAVGFGQTTTHTDLEEILSALINNYNDCYSDNNVVDYAFGYGSGVFTQQLSSSSQTPSSTNTSTSTPMIDLILSVPDTQSFHSYNARHNPNHYAMLPKLLLSIDSSPTQFIFKYIQSMGAGVYFHPMVPISNVVVKYGITSSSRLKQDLMEWDTLYIAGRMQKPTVPISISSNYSTMSRDEIEYLQQEYNLRYALSTALLLSSSYNNTTTTSTIIPIGKIYESIASISYLGDPRISAGAEDPYKIQKLVYAPGQLDRFNTLYQHLFQHLEQVGILSINHSNNCSSIHSNDDDDISSSTNNNNYNQEKMRMVSVECDLQNVSVRKYLYELLPSKLNSIWTSSSVSSSSSSSFSDQQKLIQSLVQIVGPAARIQSAKGILSAGLYKSFVYASAKLAKGVLRKR